MNSLMRELGTEIKTCDRHGDFESKGIKYFQNDVWSQCPICADEQETAMIEKQTKEDSEAFKRRMDNFYNVAGIPKRFRDIRLETFEANRNQIDAHAMAKKFCDKFHEMSKKGQTLIFCGNVGTGKTRLATAMIQTLGFGRYIRAVDISREIRATYSSNSKSEREAINSFAQIEFLVIDEVGVQTGTQNERLLFTDIIDRRYAEMKPTVICSNLNEKQLSEVFGERAWDRLQQSCLICPMVGDSLRKGDLS